MQFKYSLDSLNKKIAEHAKIEGLKLSPIKPQHLGPKGNLHMTAKEVWSLVDHLPLILPFPANEDEREVFDFGALLGKLLKCCLRRSFSEIDLSELSEIISKHHQQYLRISGKHLTAKFHYMLHYPEIIRNSGPLR